MNNFSDHEWGCKCGCGKGKADMDADFMARLDTARDIAGVPFVLTSAMRCEAHNKAEGGSGASSHLSGFAVDISANTSSDRYLIVSALLAAGFARVGVAKTFVHVDSDPSKVSNVMWVY